MNTLITNFKLLLFLVPILLLTSCSEIGLLSENNSWIVNNINSVGDFFKVYFVLQVSIIIVGVILGIFLGDLGNMISLVFHFIWIVSARDYGFFIVLLLFGFFTLVTFLIKLLKVKREET